MNYYNGISNLLHYSDSDAVFAGMSMSDEVQKELLSIIKRKMTPHPVKIRARKFHLIWGKLHTLINA